jgi:hypothetical protein
LNLFDNKNRRSSSEEDNPYEHNHQKQKHFSSHSEESEVIMFRADESSMYEDKNLPVSNCYSPSKCSKFVSHKFGGHHLQHHHSNLSTQGGGPSSSPLNILAGTGPQSFGQACLND